MAFTPSSIFERFTRQATLSPSKPAIIYKNNTQYERISYQQLQAYALALAAHLAVLEMRQLDKAVILLSNQPEWPIAFMAVQYARGIAVPVDTRLPAADVARLIMHSQAKFVLCAEKLYPNFKSFLDGLKEVKLVLVDTKGFLDGLPQPVKGEDNIHVISLDDPAVMFYTSGTTATPKAVMLSQNNLIANFESIEKVKLVNAKDVFISFLPLHHTYSFMVTCLVPLLVGATISYPASLSSEDLLDCMRKTGVTLLVGVPQFCLNFHRSISQKLKKYPFFARLIVGVCIEVSWLIRKLAGINISKVVLARLHRAFGNKLRYIITGGARLEEKVAKDFYRWGFTLLEGYGLTETSPVVAFNLPHKAKFGSVGKSLPGTQVRIVEPDQQGVGEVAVRGANVMLGYYLLPQETQAVIRDGWFLTKDLGYLDKKGYLHITGRKDELIVLSSGKKVNPEDIEARYSVSPYIKELCVFSSAETSQLMAMVVPNEEYFYSRGETNIIEKIKWEMDNVSHHLPSYKRIKGFVISKEKLPRTALGKIMRHKLADSQVFDSPEACLPAGRDTLVDYIALQEKVLHFLSEDLRRQVSIHDHLELDLGLDSLARVELLIALERFLKIKLPSEVQDELSLVFTVKDLILKIGPYMEEGLAAEGKNKFLWSEALSHVPGPGTMAMIRLRPYFLDRVVVFLLMLGVRFLFRSVFLLSVKGKENLPQKGPFVIYANHTSYLDGFIIASCLPLKVVLETYFVGLREIVFLPLLKSSQKIARLVPIDPTLNLVDSLQACAYLLKNRKVVCFFPEGQRAPSAEGIKFKRGIGILAKELNPEFVPIYIDGAFQSWPRFTRFPRPHKLTVYIGKRQSPLELAAQSLNKEMDYDSIASELRKVLFQLKPAK